MKILYSELKKFIPQLKHTPKAVADIFTLIGFMAETVEEILVGGKRDWRLSLEVRAASRPDCLYTWGLAMELAAYLNLEVIKTFKTTPPAIRPPFSATVTAPSTDIKRLLATKVEGLDNSKATPEWMKTALVSAGVNSINLLVDISNYVMLTTGFPNHFFDSSQVVGDLVWQRAPGAGTFTTLSGSIVELHAGRELVISDNLGPLVIASSVGGKRSAVSERTSSVIVEIAVYNPSKISEDVKTLKVETEAATRLAGFLPEDQADKAMQFLLKLLQDLGNAKTMSKIFDYSPHSQKFKPVSFFIAENLPTTLAGQNIPSTTIKKILKALGYQIRIKNTGFLVSPPSWRSDIMSSTSVAEDVIRLYGFDKIPPRIPKLEALTDITAPEIYLEKQLKSTLISRGYDETLTLPMSTMEHNHAAEWEDTVSVSLANAINEELPVMRTSLIAGLAGQQLGFAKKGIEIIQLLESGKVFKKQGKKYLESQHLALLVQNTDTDPVAQVKTDLEAALRSQGASRFGYSPLGHQPPWATAGSAWLVTLGGKSLGVVYQLQGRPLSGNKMTAKAAVAEIDLNVLSALLPGERPKSLKELTKPLITMEANLFALDRYEADQKLNAIQRGAARANIWALSIRDSFAKPGEPIKFTIRAVYVDLEPDAAKKLHQKLFY